MTVFLLVQKVAQIYAVLLERERFLYLLSVLRNMSLEREKNFGKDFCPFLPKNTKYEKKTLTSFFGQNVAYKTFVQLTKPWTLYLVSVLRYRRSKMKNCLKFCFFKTSFEKTHKAEIFSKTFFGENVA